MLNKRVIHEIFNWATARHELMVSSECGTGLRQCQPFYRGPSRSFQRPLVGAVPSAPPVLELPNPTVEFTCGNCGAVLMRAAEEKVYPLVVLCNSCGSYNSTDV
jgi:predicted RNA-binding Zn-ribbon protein involved in translation (DUF1610 family)